MSEEEYDIWQKKQEHRQNHLSHDQKVKQELNSLPHGKELMNWIAGHLQKRLDNVQSVLWRYVDQNQAQQQRSNRVQFLDGQTNEVLVTTEVNRQELAQMRAMNNSWILQLVEQIQDDGNQEHQSGMHEKFEDDLSERFDDMMEKLMDK